MGPAAVSHTCRLPAGYPGSWRNDPAPARLRTSPAPSGPHSESSLACTPCCPLPAALRTRSSAQRPLLENGIDFLVALPVSGLLSTSCSRLLPRRPLSAHASAPTCPHCLCECAGRREEDGRERRPEIRVRPGGSRGGPESCGSRIVPPRPGVACGQVAGVGNCRWAQRLPSQFS